VQCPNCGGKLEVSETRTKDGDRHVVRRRRSCADCKQRFTTIEQIAPPKIKVEKRRGGTELYQRPKLRRCVERVARHRPITEEQIEDIVEGIEAKLLNVRTVRWWRLAELLINALDGIDRVSASRLAANYLDEAGVLRLEDAAGPAQEPPQLGLFEPEE
jgi:transcriptional repressor NrdR